MGSPRLVLIFPKAYPYMYDEIGHTASNMYEISMLLYVRKTKLLSLYLKSIDKTSKLRQ